MLFNNMEFKAMQSGLDAMWLKQQVITNNMSNSETPGYKARVVSFENVLSDKVREGQKTNRPYDFNAKIITDNSTSMRPDGNNVDTETQSVELWKTYAQYSYLTQKISGQFKDMRYVLSQALK